MASSRFCHCFELDYNRTHFVSICIVYPLKHFLCTFHVCILWIALNKYKGTFWPLHSLPQNSSLVLEQMLTVFKHPKRCPARIFLPRLSDCRGAE